MPRVVELLLGPRRAPGPSSPTASATSSTRPQVPALTSLRFFAAAAVVLFHCHGDALDGAPQALRNLVANGYQAVPFFFVLSGFILVYVYAGSDERTGMQAAPRTFWIARFARIYPAYALAFLLILPWPAYLTFVSGLMSVPSFVTGLLSVPTLSQAWISPAITAEWNVPAWSLCAEAFFYILFPYLLGLASSVPAPRFLVAALLLLALGSGVRELPPFARPLEAFQDPALGRWGMFPPFHLPQFVLGMALGRVFLYRRSFSHRSLEAMLIFGLVSIVGLCALGSRLPDWARKEAIMAPLFGLVILGGAGAAGPLSRWLSHRRLVVLGEASYSIYILHIPLFAWWLWLLRKGIVHGLTPVAELVVFFALVVVASVATFLWVERPLRRWLLGRLR